MLKFIEKELLDGGGKLRDIHVFSKSISTKPQNLKLREKRGQKQLNLSCAGAGPVARAEANPSRDEALPCVNYLVFIATYSYFYIHVP